MNKFSNYLKKKKKNIVQLVNKLLEKYEFASVLATDVNGTNYVVDKNSSYITPSSINECGFVARVFNKGNYFEYSFNDITDKTVDDVYQTIVNIVNCKLTNPTANAHLIKEESLKKDFIRKQLGKEYQPSEIIDILKDDVAYGLKIDSRLVNVRCSIEFAEISKMYISKEKELTQYYTWINPRIFALAQSDNNMKYGYEGFGSTDADEAFKLLRDKIKPTALLACELLNSELPTPGKYTIITDPSITGLIAHEAFGHGLEMDQFVKDRAKSIEYMNKPVASKLVTMHDGAKAAISSASYFFDDEGAIAQDTKIIDHGTLIGGICDSVSASILNYHPTGNGRRESYKRKAYTRMTNTFFEKGEDTLEDMIASVDYGYYICQTDNGMEDPKNWGIQCTAAYGREIKDGKFTGKIISPVVMSGYVIDLLESISMVAKDQFEVIGSGSCGKGYKEWVRVSDGGASIKAEVKIG